MVLVYIAALLGGHWLGLNTVFFIYLIPLLFSVLFLGKYAGFVRAYLSKALKKQMLKELWYYERWMFVYSTAYNLLGRVDFFMLGFWVQYQQLGIFNAAYQLCSIVSFLPMCLGKVLLPALSELSESAVFEKTKKLIRVTGLICLAATLLIPMTAWVVPTLLGSDYVSAVPILQILLLAFILGLLSMPYEQSLYSLGRPKVLSVGRYLQLFLIVGLNVFLLPNLSMGQRVFAVAWTGLAGRLLYLCYARYFYLAYEKSVAQPLIQPRRMEQAG